MTSEHDWRANIMVFLTRDVTEGKPYEITSLEDLVRHSRQRLRLTNDLPITNGLNPTDLFIDLCGVIAEDQWFAQRFNLLSCRKEGDAYIVRVEFADEIVEKELLEMTRYVDRRVADERYASADRTKCTRFGWNADNMFFLTRDVAEGTSYEIMTCEGVLRHGNQCLFDTRDDIDEFGRNYFDKMFIRLCLLLYLDWDHGLINLLSCIKEGDKYIVRIEYVDEVVEKELLEMVSYYQEAGSQRWELMKDAKQGEPV